MRRWLFVILIPVLIISGLILYDGHRIQQTLSGQSDASRLLANESKASDEKQTDDQTWFTEQDVVSKKLTTSGPERVGQYLAATEASDKTVIVLPDDTPHQASLFSLIRLYHEQFGYHVLLVERRDTEARNSGWLDRLDLIDWTNQLIAENGPTSQILYHGLGVGGATALLAAGEADVPKQLKVVISEGAYARLDDWLAFRAKEDLPYPAGPSLAAASTFNKFRQDFFYGDVSVTRQTSRIMVPTLFIHGTDDQRVPSRMVYELYQAKPGIKQLYPVRGAGHDDTSFKDPDNYEKRLRLFIEPFVKPL
ncbi:alpha/beta hydrolase [Exiguobacterium sp. s192]|uniref:alpha/beta hydrolase n=1 Tax=Exiguobacterium sp. s192 TaxID=2751206 RepID=UPI001BE67B5C